MTDFQEPSDNELSNAGTPNPLDFRRSRPVSPQGGLFPDGATILNANTYTQILPIAGALLVRLHGKFTCAGTLTTAFRRSPPNSATAYTTPLPHASVSVLANTEFYLDINPGGESLLAVKFDPSADGEVTFFDQMQQ